jgi:hypothetical protein
MPHVEMHNDERSKTRLFRISGQERERDQAIPCLHGGGYVPGSALAYRDSASGGLTLVTPAQSTKKRRGAASIFSPWADLAFTGASMTDPDVTDPLIGYDYLQDCTRKYRGDADASAALSAADEPAFIVRRSHQEKDNSHG